MKIIQTLLLVYTTLAILFFVLSNSVMYQPPRPTRFSDTPQTLKVALPNGNKLSAVYLHHPDANYTLLFSHGNAEDLGTLLPWLQLYYQKGYSIIGYDYEGYGTSEGNPSEKNTYQDITAVYDYLTKTQKISPDNIVIIGRSLGTGPSVYLASKVPAKALVIESPFLSAYRVYTMFPLFPFDKYPNLAVARNLTLPVLVIHGTKDKVIPFWHGKQLFEAISSPKRAYWVKGAGHNDIMAVAQDNYWKELSGFLTWHLD